jgi:AcrR family transcriptional regulator
MTASGNVEKPARGLRQRKREETGKRITEAGMRLFMANGYEATTLEAIAAEAGISRRTFFHHFKSKDDILLSMQSGLGATLAAALPESSSVRRPIDAVRQAVLKSCASYTPEALISIDRLMRSSEAVQARKQASYVEHERTLFAGLRERWPEPERETALRLVAMLSIGAVRLSLEAWTRSEGGRPIEDLIDEAFRALEAEI